MILCDVVGTVVMCWRGGVLVCTAPNILYAPDDDHDDRPDTVKTLFSGFGPDNQQWEVNGLTWGLAREQVRRAGLTVESRWPLLP